MIGFNLLGNLGRIGNQMFQYASLRGISANNNYDWCIPPKQVFGTQDPNVRKSDRSIYDCFKLEHLKNKGFLNGDLFEESSFHFDEDLFNNCKDNISLSGYFQTEKYFKNIESEIREDFQFIDSIYEVSKNFFDSTFSDDVISLHVRRGDYITNPNHPVQPLSYYKNSLDNFEELPVLVFTDDPAWAKSQEIFNDDRFLISDGGDSGVDLCLMTLCKYHIIANSSYSWWGSWLAKSEKTIAPKYWFDADCSRHNTKDLYCDHWVIL